ncbi:hypothetical protein Pan181_52750 [Aeoliella mucimassa]|uniref:Uncharacterized protein n=1 Tax=Aeoliella mucimassa TaxID=2527972 RepID=A0A518AWD1_9BACT|nr:hypothetical protein Pan181_52750 [Aeoliella mucimassa]
MHAGVSNTTTTAPPNDGTLVMATSYPDPIVNTSKSHGRAIALGGLAAKLLPG